MRIAVDTNVLVRSLTEDDPRQTAIAQAELEDAELVTLSTPALCELVWVLSHGYRIPRQQIAAEIRRLVDADNTSCDQRAVEMGLAQLDAGGDFADGVIAHEGRRLGASVFVSFDRKAVRLLGDRGESVRLL